MTTPVQGGLGAGELHHGLVTPAGSVGDQDGGWIAFDIEHGLALTG